MQKEYDWMSVQGAADEVPCQVATIYRRNGRDGFPQLYKLGGKVMLKREEWRPYMASPPKLRNPFVERESA